MILFITFTLYYILYYILYIRLLNIAVYRRMAVFVSEMTILFLFRGVDLIFNGLGCTMIKKGKRGVFCG